MKKKILTLLLFIAVAAVGVFSLAACDPEEKPIITPTSWQVYVDELQEIFDNTYGTDDKCLGFALNADLTSSNDLGETTSFRVETKFNLSLDPDNETDGLSLRVQGDDVNGNFTEIVSVYANNERMYLHVYEPGYDKHSYYKYDNTPIFDIFRKAMGGAGISEVSPKNLLVYLSDTVFTSARVNEDKSAYTFGFALENVINSDVTAAFGTILKLLPDDLESGFLASLGVNSDIELLALVASMKGEAVFNVEDEKITGINIVSPQGIEGETTLDIQSLIIAPDCILGVHESEPANPGVYQDVKIGTLSIDGSLACKDDKNMNTLIDYDMSFNSSVDLVALLAAGGDVRTLDGNNYFHFNISHNCNSACTDYCSVEMGNKLRQSNGSVLDIAFSPRDFGTYNIYISVSLGAFIGQNKLNSLLAGKVGSGLESLSSLLISDYQLFVIDPGARLDLMKAESGGGQADAENALSGKLMEIYSILNFSRWSMDINLTELAAVMGDMGGISDVVNIFCDVLQTYGAENLNIDFGMPQYDAVRTYNIADAVLYIPSNEVAPGDPGTKQYDNALFSGGIKPSVSWKFDIGGADNGTFVNMLLYGDDYKQILYDINTPVSPEELKNLDNAYIAYRYKDIWGGEDVGYAKIYGAYGVDYTNTEDYQSVLLKVGYPSAVISDFSTARQILNNIFGELLYTTVRVNIKLSNVAKDKITVERTTRVEDGNDGYKEKDNYTLHEVSRNEVLEATVKYVYTDSDGSEKIKYLTQYGTCKFFDVKYGLFSGVNYIVNSVGYQKIEYNICGEKIVKQIYISRPIESILVNTVKTLTFRIGEKIDATNLEKVQYRYKYDGNTSYHSVTLPFYYAMINGRSIDDGVDRWGIEGSFENESRIITSIVFYREGLFEISYEYMGKMASFNINIVSDNVGYSEYKLTPGILRDHYFVTDSFYSFDYKLDNKTHATKGRNNQVIDFSVTRGSLNSSGNLVYYNDSNNPDLVEFTIKYDNAIVNNGYTVDLEALILNPHKIQVSLKFKRAGYYRIRLSIGGASSTFDILAENYDNIEQ